MFTNCPEKLEIKAHIRSILLFPCSKSQIFCIFEVCCL